MKRICSALLFSAALLSSCSDDDSSSDSCSKLYSYCYSLDGSDISVDGSAVTGTGSVNFGQVVDTAESGKNYELAVSLEDGGSVTLKAFTDKSLENGVSVTFTRNESAVNWTVGDHTGVLKTASLADADATKAITINVDIHNDEADEAHVILWEGNDIPGEEAEEELETHSEQVGQSTRAGLTLSGATVSNFSVTDVKISHE